MRAIFEICLRRGRLTVKSLVRNGERERRGKDGKGWERENERTMRKNPEESNRNEMRNQNQALGMRMNEMGFSGCAAMHDLRLGSTGLEGSQLVPRIWNA